MRGCAVVVYDNIEEFRDVESVEVSRGSHPHARGYDCKLVASGFEFRQKLVAAVEKLQPVIDMRGLPVSVDSNRFFNINAWKGDRCGISNRLAEGLLPVFSRKFLAKIVHGSGFPRVNDEIVSIK